MDLSSLDRQAAELVQSLADGCETNDLGSATIAIYDTAWLSLVSRTIDGRHKWQFPECFQYLLKAQAADGTWSASQGPEDQIINTMAALLALKKHAGAAASEDAMEQEDLEGRMMRATSSLQSRLQNWDVESSIHVGFEILIPAMMEMLAEESLSFTFPGSSSLQKLNKKKLSKFVPEVLYRTPTPLLHSLEAFIGKIDFDKLRHHRISGSMLGSPASTAAYLMHTSAWDDEAEMYLRKVIFRGYGDGTGGVPSVFPISIFETTWAVSTLVQGGFPAESLGQLNSDRISKYLQQHLQVQDGLLGFMPYATADADDTAKTILTLNLLGKDVRPDAMISYFKTNEGHFCTYPGERDVSFSANCNVLQALLSARNAKEYSEHIIATTSFLCKAWWKGEVKDKWNNSLHYSMMLLGKALLCLLPLWSVGIVDPIPEYLLRTQIPVVLIQILNRTMCTQHSDGSWGTSPSAEVTAYAVITLKELSALPWAVLVSEDIHSAIQAGQRFLEKCHDDWTEPQYLWIEKVTYGNPTLSKAYCLAALKPPPEVGNWHDRVKGMVSVPEEAVVKCTRFISMLSCFGNTPSCLIKLSAIEGLLFLPQLKSARADILPRQNEAKNKYLDLIPFTWIVENNTKALFLPANLLWDMMILTVCNFRADEYMETSVATMDDAVLRKTKSAISELCAGGKGKPNGIEKETRSYEDSAKMVNGTGHNHTEKDSNLDDFKVVIGHYVEAMLTYPSIQYASRIDYSLYQARLEEFLMSHIDQTQDNKRFANQASWSASQSTIFETPRSIFPRWLQTTGADSVSAPMSFAFFTCLLGASASGPSAEIGEYRDCFTTTGQKYLAHDLSARLSSFSRLYNDYGSIARDRAEANINCVNFAEFHIEKMESGSVEANEAELRKKLLALAEYEREAADRAGEKLIEALAKSGQARLMKIAKGVALFMGTTALYADMYVAKDLSNSIRRT